RVALVVLGVVVGRQLGGVDLEADLVGGVGEADVVEDEEFGLGAEIDRVTQTGGLHVTFGLLGRGAGVAVVGLVGQGLENVAVDGEGRGTEEGVDIGRVR